MTVTTATKSAPLSLANIPCFSLKRVPTACGAAGGSVSCRNKFLLMYITLPGFYQKLFRI